MDRRNFGSKKLAGYYLVFLPLFSLLGLFSLFWLVSLTFHRYGADYSIYLNAYVDARAGINPYEPFFVGTSFLNHPIVLLIVRLFFLQGGLLTSLLWSFVSVIAWLACYLIASYLSRPRSSNPLHHTLDLIDILFLILFMVFGPFLETISIGQINTLAVFFVMASLLCSELDRPILAGISIGTAMLIKTSPALFLVYFLIVRRYRVVVSALVTGIVLTLLSQIPFPIDVTTPFIETLLRLPNTIAGGRMSFSLPTLAKVMLRDIRTGELLQFVRLVHKLILVLLVGVAGWFGWRSAYRSRTVRIWLFACFQVLAVIFSPLVWYHHYVFLLFPIVLLLSENSTALQAIGMVVITSIQIERFFQHYIAWSALPTIIGSVLLLITAYVVFLRYARERSGTEGSSVQSVPVDT